MKSGPNATSRMILKEIGVAKGSQYAKLDKKGNISIEQIIAVAKKKMVDMNSYTLKSAVKEVAGACVPMGILCEGMIPKDFCAKISKGDYDEEIKSEKTTITAEKKKQLEEQLNKAQSELAGEFDALKKKLEAKAQKEATKAAKAAPAQGAKPAAGAAAAPAKK
ncbi:MAG: hypothetical protein PHN56_00910 [Candidatus Nanoarchaeia archaeon]|nr:hypothetical protein [Candidatus Nanoarchaeia archaeon]